LFHTNSSGAGFVIDCIENDYKGFQNEYSILVVRPITLYSVKHFYTPIAVVLGVTSGKEIPYLKNVKLLTCIGILLLFRWMILMQMKMLKKTRA